MKAAIDMRWNAIKGRPLLHGAHAPDGKMCVMEAVAYVAGEPWSDHPACVCSVIGAFLRRWNDDLNDTDRQMLKPFVPRLIGTKATPDIEERRAWMLMDWMIRVYTPAWLELAELKEQADVLRALPEMIDDHAAQAAQPKINAAWSAARSAAGSVARSAAVEAAWSAAVEAARSAAGETLRPSCRKLQKSALALLARMIDTK